MKAVPLELKKANEFVDELHRHHVVVYRDKFRIGCQADDGHLCGVIQVGRPVNRKLDDGYTLEVARCCTDGTKNACSFLYGRVARPWRRWLSLHNEELGYRHSPGLQRLRRILG